MDSNQAIPIELFLCWILKPAQKTESGPQNWHTEADRLIFFGNVIHSKWLKDQINFFFLPSPLSGQQMVNYSIQASNTTPTLCMNVVRKIFWDRL